MPTYGRRRRRFYTPQRARRRVDTARFHNALAAGAASVNSVRLLSIWTGDVGLAAGGRLPGLTCGPVKYRLSVQAAAAIVGDFCWGIIVENELVTTSTDFDPKVKEHLSWMEYGRMTAQLPANVPVQLVGGGDDGFRTVRARRRIPEVEHDLFLVLSTDVAVTWNVDTSTTVMLP